MKKAFAAAIAASATAVLTFAFAIPASATEPEPPPPVYLYAGGTHGSGQPSHTSETEWQAFLGAGQLTPVYTVQYPRDLAPLVGDTTLDDSVDDGVEEALRLIQLHDEGASIYLVGVSQGAVVMARTKQELIAQGFDPTEITVFTYGDPTNADGGFLAKLDAWNINIPGFKPVTHTPGEGAYVTVAIEYDLIADSPDNLNPVSWVNAALGAAYDHSSYSLDQLNAAGENGVVSETEQWYADPDDTQAVAYYQHNLIKQKNLPLTRPLRDFGTAVADDQGDVVVNRAVDRLDNVLRPIVDAGYDGGEPGGSRHVDTLIQHGKTENADAVADPNRSTLAGPVDAKPKQPLRDDIKTVRNEIKKKFRDSLTPKDNEN